jgi:hypothetical protein
MIKYGGGIETKVAKKGECNIMKKGSLTNIGNGLMPFISKRGYPNAK